MVEYPSSRAADHSNPRGEGSMFNWLRNNRVAPSNEEFVLASQHIDQHRGAQVAPEGGVQNRSQDSLRLTAIQVAPEENAQTKTPESKTRSNSDASTPEKTKRDTPSKETDKKQREAAREQQKRAFRDALQAQVDQMEPTEKLSALLDILDERDHTNDQNKMGIYHHNKAWLAYLLNLIKNPQTDSVSLCNAISNLNPHIEDLDSGMLARECYKFLKFYLKKITNDPKLESTINAKISEFQEEYRLLDKYKPILMQEIRNFRHDIARRVNHYLFAQCLSVDQEAVDERVQTINTMAPQDREQLINSFFERVEKRLSQYREKILTDPRGFPISHPSFLDGYALETFHLSDSTSYCIYTMFYDTYYCQGKKRNENAATSSMNCNSIQR